MADAKLTALTETSVAALDDVSYTVDISDTTDDAAGSSRKISFNRLGGLFIPSYCDGRLTTESGVAVSTSDRTSQGTIYFTPYLGNRITIYDGTRWKLYSFTERSLALTATSGKNYDVFIYDNAGTLALELSAAWTNDSTRADALTTQDGVYVKSGATTRRWLGTIRASGTNVVEDSEAKRFVWNAFNQQYRSVYKTETTDTWSYGTNTWRQANGSSSNQIEVVLGSASVVSLNLIANAYSGSAPNRWVGIGVDSTTSPSGVRGVSYASNADVPCFANYVGSLSAGYHYLAWLEKADGSVAFSGDNAGDGRNCGMSGFLEN